MKGNASRGPRASPQVRRAAVKWAIQSIFGLVGYGLVLFLTAGRLDWLWGWALLPGIAAGVMYIVRTHLEDRALRQELPGYEEYAQQTHYRLLPGIW